MDDEPAENFKKKFNEALEMGLIWEPGLIWEVEQQFVKHSGIETRSSLVSEEQNVFNGYFDAIINQDNMLPLYNETPEKIREILQGQDTWSENIKVCAGKTMTFYTVDEYLALVETPAKPSLSDVSKWRRQIDRGSNQQ